MNWKEEWDFTKWELERALLGTSFRECSWYWKIVRLLGTVIVIIGVIVFLTAPQWGTSTYDVTQKLNAPAPMTGRKTLRAENNRVYVFGEEMCAVNVYSQDGTFLFCVRGERNQNGLAKFFLHENDIYIVSRMRNAVRFNENGDYLEITDESLIDEVNAGTVPSYAKAFTDGEIQYQAFLNKVYRIAGGQKTLFAETPLYLYYIHSPILGWISALLGALLRELPEKIYRRKSMNGT